MEDPEILYHQVKLAENGKHKIENSEACLKKQLAIQLVYTEKKSKRMCSYKSATSIKKLDGTTVLANFE